ncbi:MAG TPA: class I SAM-dependent methyltransferase [Acidimicrobiales bacterium]|jgi:SAM-dependent methyltransferase|nr:class I SAM-dependent methyltransferase [Acidimicrobiales bacterium]
MADAIFEEQRLAEVYDPLHPDRGDLDLYLALAAEFNARSALDIGCGTGTLACLLAQRGLDVTAVDPAAASLEVARTKSRAEQVEWIHGDVASLPPLQVDLVIMSGNVAQVFLTDDEWTATLMAVGSALRPGGHLVFECRDPAREVWREWSRRATCRQVELPEIGALETWVDLVDVDPPFVSFRWTFIFGFDGAVLTSDSTLRFREQGEITDSLGDVGFVVEAVLDAPDRPGQEFVFVATRASVLRTQGN